MNTLTIEQVFGKITQRNWVIVDYSEAKEAVTVADGPWFGIGKSPVNKGVKTNL
jgi:hypothetical protein